tara:strand:- start:402 stop:713 length:312 start_codon:yes stop_codon:yes gene_type:complete
LRVTPSYTFRSTKETLIETIDITFSDEEEKTVILTEKYSGLPTVIATAKVTSAQADDNATPVGNVNVFIKAVSIENKNVTVTVATSAQFTGTISVQSIFIAGG